MSNNQKRTVPNSEVTIEAQIFKDVGRLSDQALTEASQLLSIWGMTVLQYHTLRILYFEDSANEGLPSKEIGKQLYTRVPDVTRLLDRLADKGWVTRERDTNNRRVVRSRLTTIGIELVESATLPLQKLESQQLTHLSKEEKETLANLLAKTLNKSFK